MYVITYMIILQHLMCNPNNYTLRLMITKHYKIYPCMIHELQ